MTEWMPIETAPKDGRCVLVDCCLVESDMTLALCEPGGLVSAWDGKPFQGFQPTHWMPLPEPPAS